MEPSEIEGYKAISATINQTTLIASGLITISITMYEKVVKVQSPIIRSVMATSWICFALSIFAGFFCNHWVSYYLALDGEENGDGVVAWEKRHFFLFSLGILSLILFGFLSIIKKQTANQTSGTAADMNWKNATSTSPLDQEEVLVSHNGDKHLCFFDSTTNKFVSKENSKLVFSSLNELHWMRTPSP